MNLLNNDFSNKIQNTIIHYRYEITRRYTSVFLNVMLPKGTLRFFIRKH